MRFPEGSAVAMPMLMSFLMMILSSSRELLIMGERLMTLTRQSMKMGVQVNVPPSLFSNSFFTRSLHSTILVTSASAKLVTWGLVCLLSTMCLAMSLRMRSIGTISTFPADAAAVGGGVGEAEGCDGAAAPTVLF